MALDESRSKRANPKARMPRRTSGFTILLVVLAVCVLAMFGYLLWPSQEAVVTPSPSPPPVAASPSPIPPTSEQDIAAAKEAYADYHAALWNVGADGKNGDFLKHVRPHVTGNAWEYAKDEAKAKKKNNFTFKGESPVFTVTGTDRPSSKVVVLSVCIDQREMSAKRPDGSKVKLLDWISSQARMQLVGDEWKLTDRDDEIEDGPCI